MIITVSGRSYYGSTAEEYMADMLRYDNGEVLYLLEQGRNFFAVVFCEIYTQDRWSSFGLITKEDFHPFSRPEKTEVIIAKRGY